MVQKKPGYEMPHYTEYDLYSMSRKSLVWAYCLLQNKFERLRDRDYEDLKERYRILNVRLFGRSSEQSSIRAGKPDRIKTRKRPGRVMMKIIRRAMATQIPETKRKANGILSDPKDALARLQTVCRLLMRI